MAREREQRGSWTGSSDDDEGETLRSQPVPARLREWIAPQPKMRLEPPGSRPGSSPTWQVSPPKSRGSDPGSADPGSGIFPSLGEPRSSVDAERTPLAGTELELPAWVRREPPLSSRRARSSTPVELFGLDRSGYDDAAPSSTRRWPPPKPDASIDPPTPVPGSPRQPVVAPSPQSKRAPSTERWPPKRAMEALADRSGGAQVPQAASKASAAEESPVDRDPLGLEVTSPGTRIVPEAFASTRPPPRRRRPGSP
jgi:hypothetical protein